MAKLKLRIPKFKKSSTPMMYMSVSTIHLLEPNHPEQTNFAVQLMKTMPKYQDKDERLFDMKFGDARKLVHVAFDKFGAYLGHPSDDPNWRDEQYIIKHGIFVDGSTGFGVQLRGIADATPKKKMMD